MQALPHRYEVTVAGGIDDDVELTAEPLERLLSASPAEFDGPGNRWSPEMLLVGSVGDCLVLTFRAVALASKLPWTALRCRVTGTLDRVERTIQFTAFEVHANLDVPAGVDPERARRVLDKAEQNCLISNSLKAPVHLWPVVEVAGTSAFLAAGA